MVSKAMSRSATPLPWHRVVKSDRTLAFAAGSEAYDRQKNLLAKEGVGMTNGKVRSRESIEGMDLDRLIWGLEDG